MSASPPIGWKRANLGDFMVARAGSVDPKKFPDEDFDLYSIPAHDRGAGGYEVVRGSEIGSSKKVLEPDDVMISKIVPHIRRSRVVGPIGERRQISSTEWITLRSGVHEPKFLKYFLLSDEFHTQFMRTVSGVGGSLMRAQPARVRPIEVPVPLLDEQRRIVEILEDHLSRLDAADASLGHAKLRIKRMLASAQDSRVWNPGVETVAIRDVLREKIRNGHSARAVQGSEAGIRTLTLTAVTLGAFRDEYTKITTADPTKVSDLWLQPGDIFVQRANTPELVGTAAIYQGPKNWAIFPDLMIRLRVDESRARPAYVALALAAERTHRSLRSRAKGLAGSMPKVDQAAIASTRIPLPALDEQDRVLLEVGSVRDAGEHLAREVDRAERRSRGLRRAIMTAAFSGRLTGMMSDIERVEEMAGV